MHWFSAPPAPLLPVLPVRPFQAAELRFNLISAHRDSSSSSQHQDPTLFTPKLSIIPFGLPQAVCDLLLFWICTSAPGQACPSSQGRLLD